MGNLLLSVCFAFWLDTFCISYWKYAGWSQIYFRALSWSYYIVYMWHKFNIQVLLLLWNRLIYLQSEAARLEEMRLKGQEIELWMAFHSLPRKLKKRIWQYQKYRWQETRGVDVESFLHNLPRDIRRETKQHLCSLPLSKVSYIENYPYI